MPQSPDLLTVEQFAPKLSVSRRIGWRMVAAEELSALLERSRKWARSAAIDVYAYRDELLSQRPRRLFSNFSTPSDPAWSGLRPSRKFFEILTGIVLTRWIRRVRLPFLGVSRLGRIGAPF